MTVCGTLNVLPLFFIEELIVKQKPLNSILRLICLLNVTLNGLPINLYNNLRKEIVHSYGHETLLTLNNLEYAGLIRKQKNNDYSSKFTTIRKTLKIFEEIKENYNDIGFCFGGYSPISVRLVQNEDNWKNYADVLDQPCGYYEKKAPKSSKNVTLVVFVGGVTFAEISALRFLTEQEEKKN